MRTPQETELQSHMLLLCLLHHTSVSCLHRFPEPAGCVHAVNVHAVNVHAEGRVSAGRTLTLNHWASHANSWLSWSRHQSSTRAPKAQEHMKNNLLHILTKCNSVSSGERSSSPLHPEAFNSVGTSGVRVEAKMPKTGGMTYKTHFYNGGRVKEEGCP